MRLFQRGRAAEEDIYRRLSFDREHFDLAAEIAQARQEIENAYNNFPERERPGSHRLLYLQRQRRLETVLLSPAAGEGPGCVADCKKGMPDRMIRHSFFPVLQFDLDLPARALIGVILHARRVKHAHGGGHGRCPLILVAVVDDLLDPALDDRLGALVAGEEGHVQAWRPPGCRPGS